MIIFKGSSRNIMMMTKKKLSKIDTKKALNIANKSLTVNGHMELSVIWIYL